VFTGLDKTGECKKLSALSKTAENGIFSTYDAQKWSKLA